MKKSEIYRKIVDENISTKKEIRDSFPKEFHDFCFEIIKNIKKKSKRNVPKEWAYFNKPISERKKYIFELKLAVKCKLPFDFFYEFSINYNYYQHTKKYYLHRRENYFYIDYSNYRSHAVYSHNFFFNSTRRIFTINVIDTEKIEARSSHYGENTNLTISLPMNKFSKIKKIGETLTFLNPKDKQQACECLFLIEKGNTYSSYFSLVEGFLVKGRHFKKKRGCETLARAIELERNATAARVNNRMALKKNFDKIEDFLVSYKDSLKVGNCPAGTNNFIKNKIIPYFSSKLNQQISFEDAKKMKISIKELLTIENNTHTRRLLAAKK